MSKFINKYGLSGLYVPGTEWVYKNEQIAVTLALMALRVYCPPKMGILRLAVYQNLRETFLFLVFVVFFQIPNGILHRSAQEFAPEKKFPTFGC